MEVTRLSDTWRTENFPFGFSSPSTSSNATSSSLTIEPRGSNGSGELFIVNGNIFLLLTPAFISLTSFMMMMGLFLPPPNITDGCGSDPSFSSIRQSMNISSWACGNEEEVLGF
jgi:hypothetical protein